jgi:YVTN family beta-propeller protein
MEVTRAFAVEPAPHNLAVTPAGQAWLTALGGQFLWLVDLQDGRLVSRVKTAARPHDLALTRQGDALWVANWGSGDVFVVHGGPPQVERVRISGRQPHHVAITPDEQQVWITNHGSEDISVIDAAARRERTRIPVGMAPHHVAFSQDGRWAYVANSGSNDVSVVDVAARREVGRLPAGAHPHGGVAIPDGP